MSRLLREPDQSPRGCVGWEDYRHQQEKTVIPPP